MADEKKAEINRRIVGFTKARKILFFTIKPKPIYEKIDVVAEGTGMTTKSGSKVNAMQEGAVNIHVSPKLRTQLAPALVEIGLRMTPEQYIKTCSDKSIGIGLLAFALGVVVIYYMQLTSLLVLAPLIGLTAYMMSYNALVQQPIDKVSQDRKAVENDILFAARDMIVSMRSGLPLFNAMATVSVGYGSASKEFKRIIDRVQLGMPMEEAIEEVSAKSQSPTFKRVMLQAGTSIKVGSDVVTAIQEVINDVSQERVIDLRRYGQRLNAIAMFYMLFGVIFPSMGLAVASIMSTFISIFPVNNNTLVLAVFVMAALQFVFLKMVSSSRPAFAT